MCDPTYNLKDHGLSTEGVMSEAVRVHECSENLVVGSDMMSGGGALRRSGGGACTTTPPG
jgi:hypothetical protein